MIKVSIVEDSKEYSQILSKSIDAEPDMSCLSQYPNVRSAKKNLIKDAPDVLILDIELPDGSGVDLVSYFKKAGLKSYIIMCTSFDDERNVYKSLVRGALGYILKSDASGNITDSIREIVNGGSPMSPQIARKVVDFFSKEQNANLPKEILSTREDQLLKLLAKGLLYKEAALKLQISIETVRKHVHNIYKKLQVSNRTEALNKYFNRK